MKIATVLSLIAVVGPTPALALLDDTADALGVYFDASVYEQNVLYSQISQPFHVYFVLGHPGHTEICGFEFAWNYDPVPAIPPILSDFTLPPYSLNLGTPFNLLVGLLVPLIESDAIVLADATLVLLAPIPCTYIALGPAIPASVPGHMLYCYGESIGEIHFMTIPAYDGVTFNDQGWTVPGVATLGCPGPAGTEAQSWSTIKALHE